MVLGFARVSLLAMVALSACSSDSDDGSAAPDFATVFDTLPAPTPNKLRGVWSMGDASTTRHLRFMDGYVVGATRCISADKTRSILVGTSAKLETSSLDAATGTFTIGALHARKQDGDITCALSVAGNTYDFVIAERQLTLSVLNATATNSLATVGD